VRPVLLSIERWDLHWRRNQQLASRIPGTVFVEPASSGVRAARRREGDVTVITPPKPLPFRIRGARLLAAVLTARLVRRELANAAAVTWATHPYQLPIARALRLPSLYDRTDDWPAMETKAAARRDVDHLERGLVTLARRVVIVSEGMRSQVGKEAVLIPNGVDYAGFAEGPRRRWPGSQGFLVGFAGTLDPFRIDVDMLRGLASVPGVELLLIGGGPAGDVPGHVAGPTRHEEVAALLRGCDALVAPYRLDCEANRTSDALKFYEYFATGLPVIATPIAGFERHPDLVVQWPLTQRVVEACGGTVDGAAARRGIARDADWSVRALAMQELLVTA